jgi:desulfoferrodoxin (superoxide reductase-like protein)
MKKAGIVLVALTLFSLAVCMVSADVPTVTDIQVESTTDGDILTISIRHSGPSSAHYVDKIEVKIGEDVEVFELENQSETTFTEEIDVTGEPVEVRAYCTLHGWSAWKEVESDTVEAPEQEEPSGGIPGFPLLAVGLGLALVLRRDG